MNSTFPLIAACLALPIEAAAEGLVLATFNLPSGFYAELAKLEREEPYYDLESMAPTLFEANVTVLAAPSPRSLDDLPPTAARLALQFPVGDGNTYLTLEETASDSPFSPRTIVLVYLERYGDQPLSYTSCLIALLVHEIGRVKVEGGTMPDGPPPGACK